MFDRVGLKLEGFSFLPRDISCCCVKLCSTCLRSNAEDFDFESLIFDEPDFSFFASREFFLSDHISCERPLEDLTLERIPTSSDQKRAFAEQRFIVKNARDALHTVSRQDSTYIKNLKERLGAEVERGPAVELHMFPRNLQNVTAPSPS